MNERLLIVGNALPFHIGGHFLAAAEELGVPAAIADLRAADGDRFSQLVSWRLRDRRPARMASFENRVVDRCGRDRPKWLLVTGLAPLSRGALQAIGARGTLRLNFLTDDPWNPMQKSQWFLAALPEYDVIFTPRQANVADLLGAGCRRVNYLPFGFSRQQHYPESIPNRQERGPLGCDILFVGGADGDRLPWIAALLKAEFSLGLYGGYWDRNPRTRAAARGIADVATLRRATAAARLTLILVRRANRDGHVMRTFEAAASGACMLVEDSPEHRSLFGAEEDCVCYFDDAAGMVAQARRLLGDANLRERLSRAVQRRVAVDGSHCYTDRLKQILECGAAG